MGRLLSDVLVELQDRGLQILFSSRVVAPEMRVSVEPTTTEPRLLLDEVLHPLGLEALMGLGDTILIVLAEGRESTDLSTMLGTVRSRRGGTAVFGVRLRLLPSGREVATSKDGSFEIPGVPVGVHSLEVRHPEFVLEHRDGIEVRAGAATSILITLQPAPLTHDRIVVRPSQASLLRETASAPLALSRQEIDELPHLGDDVFRALSLLPGVTGNDVSARFHLRGGRHDETLILLDGQELYEAYHLKDFDSALSIVPAASLASVDLSTGASSVSYGDRMSGVLHMSTRTPSGPRRQWLGMSILHAQAGAAGTLRQEKGSWIASLRRGSPDLTSKLLGDEKPTFWDLFAKTDQRFGRHSLRLSGLSSGDELEFDEINQDGESKSFATDYDSSYLWLTHQSVLRDNLFVDSLVSTSKVDRDRRGFEDEEELTLDVVDLREMEVHGLLQGWNMQASSRHFLKWGFEARRFESDYDYTKSVVFKEAIGNLRDPEDVTEFLGAFRDERSSVHFSDVITPVRPLSLEIGLRYDHNTLTEDSVYSPRLNLAWSIDARSSLRIAWGHFFQGQRLYELQVEDGERSFHRAERSEEWIAGFSHRFESGTGVGLTSFRWEVYHRSISDPRPRYENLLEPINTFPETELDRVRIAPDFSTSRGTEVFLRGRPGPSFGWWLNYAYARIKDRIDGADVRRLVDQPHTINLDMSYRLGAKWNLNLAWRYHTGRPTTAISLEEIETEEGDELVPVFGALNAERLADYHRLDLRASRTWETGSGLVSLFIDVQNVYNRENQAGFDIEIDEEQEVVLRTPESWPGFLPSIGILWEF